MASRTRVIQLNMKKKKKREFKVVLEAVVSQNAQGTLSPPSDLNPISSTIPTGV